MKVLTVFGTRPEIIRLSLILKLLDTSCDHVTVHTGQNFDPNLSDVFFEQLQLRPADRNLEIKGDSFGAQVADLFSKSEAVFNEFSPDRILLLGDTNSALIAMVAARRGVPVFHLEAGNRCYDDRVPEEINRRAIDHCSTVLMPYTDRSKENLVREGIERERIFITGNPIGEVLNHFKDSIDTDGAVAKYQLRPSDYFLATIHRAENVDRESTLREIFAALAEVSAEFEKPVIVSVHPRTASRLGSFGIDVDRSNIRLMDALPFFEFISLEKHAFMVLTDSGTVQEECSIFRVRNVTLRNVTERPETVECGSNILGGTTKESILRAVRAASGGGRSWAPPAGYEAANVSEIVRNIVLGHTSHRRHI